MIWTPGIAQDSFEYWGIHNTRINGDPHLRSIHWKKKCSPPNKETSASSTLMLLWRYRQTYLLIIIGFGYPLLVVRSCLLLETVIFSILILISILILPPMHLKCLAKIILFILTFPTKMIPKVVLIIMTIMLLLIFPESVESFFDYFKMYQLCSNFP